MFIQVSAKTPVDFDKKIVKCKLNAKKYIKLNDSMSKNYIAAICKVEKKHSQDVVNSLRFKDAIKERTIYCEFNSQNKLIIGSCFFVK
ncbi:MAG: hypothetical protein RL017_867 [Pseudomonadota bacterium]